MDEKLRAAHLIIAADNQQDNPVYQALVTKHQQAIQAAIIERDKYLEQFIPEGLRTLRRADAEAKDEA